MKNANPPLTISAEYQEQLIGESLICGVLGKILYTYPERSWIQSLADESVFEEIPFGEEQPDTVAGTILLRNWSETSKGGMSDEAFDEIRADYTRLFIGPGKVLAPPWESVYVSYTGLTFQEETLDVRQWYARFGLQFEKLHKEPDDHIGLELAFISILAGRTNNAINQNEEEEFGNLIKAQREFVTEHILKWGPVWCRKVAAESQTDFYRGTALITRGTIGAVADLLQINSSGDDSE